MMKKSSEAPIYRLRRAELRDLPVLLEFEQGIVCAERPMDETIAEGEVHYYDLKAMLSDPSACVLVAEVGETLVASGHARIREARPYLDHDQYAYLGFMYTRPEHRGKGINRAIIDGLVAWAGEKGIPEIRLTVYANNPGAIKAYEKAGFTSHLIEMRIPR